ncbi:hypothetical protein QBL02_03330 [Leucobacter sp. UT-8R-CII-1-4]|uniref:hypothetical protein n=1 Tax=Leucobacter sp. UT-8R-CII-1-4 TaxID=3040075 RepID=UPI0024A9571D|nr:hypothetical protein [Leucobacter sp. UT-8R-CII-1-4]MDI6022573.1 hypothetical protein [Leucobacter sp. UT-8R-CII-1-4]
MTREFEPEGEIPEVAEDRTVVVSGDDTVAISNDRTRVAAKNGRRERRIAERAEQEDAARQQSLSRSDPAPPVKQPLAERELLQIVDSGLDPHRPIALAPGVAPWEVAAERGVSRGLPVSYGARPSSEMPLQTGRDEIFRRVGLPPAQTETTVVQGRDQLPSLKERDRRRKVTTLAVYFGVIVISVVGLYAVAAIAFEW